MLGCLCFGVCYYGGLVLIEQVVVGFGLIGLLGLLVIVLFVCIVFCVYSVAYVFFGILRLFDWMCTSVWVSV